MNKINLKDTAKPKVASSDPLNVPKGIDNLTIFAPNIPENIIKLVPILHNFVTNLKEIEIRKNEIHELLQGEITLEQMEIFEKEVSELEEQRKTFELAKEKRQVLIEATLRGEGKVVEEPQKETRKMDLENIKNINSVEYREAFLLNLQGKATPEQRTAVSASVAIPTIIVLDKGFNNLLPLTFLRSISRIT